jgi:hypothetical protein
MTFYLIVLVSTLVREEGRPEINEEWPSSIKDLLRTSFDAAPRGRPTMAVALDIIRSTLAEMRNGDVSRLRDSYLSRRRTIESTRNLVAVNAARRHPSIRMSELRASIKTTFPPLPKFNRKTTV